METIKLQNFKKSKWALDFSHKNKQEKNTDIPSPPGYTPSVTLFQSLEYLRKTDSNHLIIKKSWDLALGPLKQIPASQSALYTTAKTFKVIEGTHAFGQKSVYFFGQLVNIALALYKCQSMGLLPTHTLDWLAFVEPKARVESQQIDFYINH